MDKELIHEKYLHYKSLASQSCEANARAEEQFYIELAELKQQVDKEKALREDLQCKAVDIRAYQDQIEQLVALNEQGEGEKARLEELVTLLRENLDAVKLTLSSLESELAVLSAQRVLTIQNLSRTFQDFWCDTSWSFLFIVPLAQGNQRINSILLVKSIV